MNKLEFRMDIPAVTWEYTPGSCLNYKSDLFFYELVFEV